MPKKIWLCLALILFLSVPAQAQLRIDDSTAAPLSATALPMVRVTTDNPREINVGKPATFNISVVNEGKTVANGVVVNAQLPAHAELTSTSPRPAQVDGRSYKFVIGDLAPGANQRITLIAVPKAKEAIRVDSTLSFATSTSSTVLVRQPVLKITTKAPADVVIQEKADLVVRVSNTGDGPAENVVVTPKLEKGQIQGDLLSKPVNLGTLKAGETKEIPFSVIPSQRGELAASFVTTNPDGLQAAEKASLKVLQAQLAVATEGPAIQPIARSGLYQIRITNPGDAVAGSTMVTVKLPRGLEVTSAAQNAYDEETRSLRWRITSLRPTDVVNLNFQAESVVEGDQTLEVIVRSERIADATAKHTTTVISRANPVVTLMNDQELAIVGDPINFRVQVVNAGSKPAEQLIVKALMLDGFEAVPSNDYKLADGAIEFPPQKLAPGEKVTLNFRAIGRRTGEHRVRVLLNGDALARELAYEGSAFYYAEKETPVNTTEDGGVTLRVPGSTRR